MMESALSLKGLTKHLDQIFEMGGGFLDLALVAQGTYCALIADCFKYPGILSNIGHPSR